MTTPIDGTERRRSVRYMAAGIAAAVAIVYTLIGVSAISVVDVAPGDEASMLAFGLPAAAAFAIGAALLMLTDRRLLWVLGAVLQVLVISMYFAVAPTRVPNFEMWGILIRIAQVTLLTALVYLAVTRPQPKQVPSGVR
jgi:hypothetical protein